MVLNASVTMPFIMAEPFLPIKMTVISSVLETVLKIAEQEAECLCTVLELYQAPYLFFHRKVACQPTGSTWAAFSKFAQFYVCRFRN